MPIKIFVGNIIDITEPELQSMFEKYGVVTEVACLGKFGFVHMESEAAGKEAIKELNNTKYNGQNMNVMVSKKKEDKGSSDNGYDRGGRGKPSFGKTKIFVGNIKPTTSNEELRLLFEAYGEVVSADVCGPYGFVHMENLEGALHAIKALQGYFLNGSNLQVELSTKNTQGRKKAEMNEYGSYDEYNAMPPPGPMRNHSFQGPRSTPYNPMQRGPRMGGMGPYGGPSMGNLPPVNKINMGNKLDDSDSFAKELLRLYLSNPVAFDRYARDPQVQLALNLDVPPSVPNEIDIKDSFYNNDFTYYEEPKGQSDHFLKYR